MTSDGLLMTSDDLSDCAPHQVLRRSEPSWTEAKKQMGDPGFLNQLINFDKVGDFIHNFVDCLPHLR